MNSMQNSGLKIFFWGKLYNGSTSLSRHDALKNLGHQVLSGSSLSIYENSTRMAFRLARHFSWGPLVWRENEALISTANDRYDLIWIDKGRLLSSATLEVLRGRAARIVHFTPDPMFLDIHTTAHFRACIPLYDLHATTKPEEVEKYRAHGARRVVLVGKSFNPEIHHPYPEIETIPFRSDVAFVGAWSSYKERVIGAVIHALPNAQVKIWGPNWRRKARDPRVRRILDPARESLHGSDYGRALAGARVALGLLSWDFAPDEVITDRVIEIPACGTLLLAPRTPAISRIFGDGEALLFEGIEDLILKLKWALGNESESALMARKGHQRIMAGGFRDEDVVRTVLDTALSVPIEK